MAGIVMGTLRMKLNRNIFHMFYSSEPQPKNKVFKSIIVAIIGAPNSGKSTLINNIVDRKICAASNKVHTTTRLARAIAFENDTQIIFLDTPGVVTGKELKKYNLPESMTEACYKSLRCANVIGVVHDVSNRWTKDSLHSDIVQMLNVVSDIPSFLILNKVDMLKSKKQLLDVIKNLTNGNLAGKPIPKSGSSKKLLKGYSKFSDVFLVSALKGDGISDIKQYLLNNARETALQYSPEKWSDQDPQVLITETVRAKFLDFLSQEIPYSLITQLEYFEENEEENNIRCSVVVECPSERLLRLISGAEDGRLRQITLHVRNDLMDIFRKRVDIDIHLKVRNSVVK